MSQGKCWWKETLLTMGIVMAAGGAIYGGYKGGEVVVDKAKDVIRSLPYYDVNRWFYSNAAAFEKPVNDNVAQFDAPKVV